MITISEIKELNIYSHLYTEVLLKIEELLKLTHGIELNSRKSFLRKSVRDMGTVAYLKDEKCVLNVLPYPESFWTKEQVLFYPKTINTCIYKKEFRGEKVFIKA